MCAKYGVWLGKSGYGDVFLASACRKCEKYLEGRERIAGATPVVTDAADSPLQWLYAALDFGAGDRIDAAQLSTGLRRLGELRCI